MMLRSKKYLALLDLCHALTDPDRLVDEPDSRSAHGNSVRIVGYSPTAGMVITVVALRDRHGVLRGASAWKTRGAALRQYGKDRDDA